MLQEQLDAFLYSLYVSQLSRQLLAEGALSASFALFSPKHYLLMEKTRHKIWQNSLFPFLFFGATLVILVGIFLAPLLVKIWPQDLLQKIEL